MAVARAFALTLTSAIGAACGHRGRKPLFRPAKRKAVGMNAVRTGATIGRGHRSRQGRNETDLSGPMEFHLARLLARCLDAQQRGTSVEGILAKHPLEAAELRPLLEIAAMLQGRDRPGRRQPYPARR